MAIENIQVRAVEPADVEAVQALARRIWHAHYPGIISVAQIEYMLDERYRPEVVRAELARDDVWWELATIAGDAIGFSSCLRSGAPGEMKLDKLYVLQAWQGHGVGRRLLERVIERCRSLACPRLVLAVNKRNSSSIAAYERWGFRIEQAVTKDIGGGFVMDDYVMVLAL
jgi:GNAT superfamily N-acetyltransferase